MTASIDAVPVKGNMLAAPCPSRSSVSNKLEHQGILSDCCSSGKLKNLRNYYARRRPAVKPRIHQPSRRPIWRITPPLPSDGEDSVSVVSSCASSVSSSQSRVVVKGVRFQPEEIIHEIPSRKDYCRAVKLALWIPMRELKNMIRKNHAEFHFEGRDWRKVPEEEEFSRNEQGQLVHPVHLAQKKRSRQPSILRPLKIRRTWSGSTSNNRLRNRRLPLSGNYSNEVMKEEDSDSEVEEA